MPTFVSSGVIKLSALAAIFGLPQPYKLSQLLKGGTYVSSSLAQNAQIPTTTSNVKFSKYYGAAKETIVIDTIVRQFPPIALAQNTQVVSGQAYGNGTYVCSSSSSNPSVAYNTSWSPFQYLYGTQGYYSSWTSASFYNQSTGVYSGAKSTQGYAGEWWQVQLPVPILLTSIKYTHNSESHVLLGSTDGTSWAIIRNVPYTGTSNELVNVNITSSVAYKYFRIVIMKTRQSSGFIFDPRPDKGTIFGTFVITGKIVTVTI